MAAANPQTMTIYVTMLLSGETFEITDFDPRHDQENPMEDRIKKALRRRFLKYFPYGQSITIRRMNSADPITEVHEGDRFISLTESKQDKPVIRLVSCRNIPAEPGMVLYEFALDKKDGVQIRSMEHFNEHQHEHMYQMHNMYTPAEMKEYVNDPSKPDFQLIVSYNPNGMYYIHIENPSNDNSIHAAYWDRKEEDDKKYFSRECIYQYSVAEAERRDVSYMYFRLKAAAVKQLLSLLEKYKQTCPTNVTASADASFAALSLNNEKQEGGKRKSRKQKRQGKIHRKIKTMKKRGRKIRG